MTKRWHVIAQGSDEHPNIDGEFDAIPEGLLYKYPFVSIQGIKSIPVDEIKGEWP